jgi:hypothetical protein
MSYSPEAVKFERVQGVCHDIHGTRMLSRMSTSNFGRYFCEGVAVRVYCVFRLHAFDVMHGGMSVEQFVALRTSGDSPCRSPGL